MGKRKTPLDSEQIKDAERAEKLFKNKCALTQDEFAIRYGFGTGSNLNHYLNGEQPFSLDKLERFCRGLGVRVREVSPTWDARMSAWVADGLIAAPTEDPDGAVRSALFARYPELTLDDIELLVGFIEGRLAGRGPGRRHGKTDERVKKKRKRAQKSGR